jgi:hypothetical protein
MKRMAWVAPALIALVVTALLAFRAGTSQLLADAPSASSVMSAPPSLTDAPPAAPASSAREAVGAPAVMSLFVRAWLGPNLHTRQAGLDATCSPRLAGLLALTDPAKIPVATPLGPPAPVHQTATTATYEQRLSDGSSIAIDLAADPTRRAGWIVTAVRPGET